MFSLFPLRRLMHLRSVCRNWKDRINGGPCYQLNRQTCRLFEIFKYDKNIYDENYYIRQVIKTQWEADYPEYRKLKLVHFKLGSTGFEDFEKSYFPTDKELPPEWIALLNIFRIYPAVQYKIIPMKIIKKIVQSHWNKFLTGNSETNNRIDLIPVLYLEENQIIIYHNIIDPDIRKDFSSSRLYGKYTLEEDVTEITDFIQDMEERIQYSYESKDTQYFPHNILNNLSYLTDLFNI